MGRTRGVYFFCLLTGFILAPTTFAKEKKLRFYQAQTICKVQFQKLSAPSVDNEELGRWFAAARSGDTHAQAVVSEALVPHIQRMLKRIGVYDSHTIEDMTQDILMRIHRAGYQYDPAQGPFFNYLMPIVRRQGMRLGKKIRPQSWHEEPLDDSPHIRLADEDPAPIQNAITAELWAKIEEAIAKVPVPMRREALTYRLIYGWTNNELAAAAQLIRATTSKRYTQGLEELREILGPDFVDTVVPDHLEGPLKVQGRD